MPGAALAAALVLLQQPYLCSRWVCSSGTGRITAIVSRQESPCVHNGDTKRKSNEQRQVGGLVGNITAAVSCSLTACLEQVGHTAALHSVQSQTAVMREREKKRAKNRAAPTRRRPAPRHLAVAQNTCTDALVRPVPASGAHCQRTGRIVRFAATVAAL